MTALADHLTQFFNPRAA